MRTAMTALLGGLIAAAALFSPAGPAWPRRVHATYPDTSVAIEVGVAEAVFGPSQQCDRSDIPDNSARLVRASDGSVAMAMGNAPSFRMLFGRSIDELHRDCGRVSLRSRRSTDPADFHGMEWVMSLYRIGDTLHALIHDEFHDARAPTCLAGEDGPANPCWYNAITYAYSLDAGHSFTFLPDDKHVVAAPSVPWSAPALSQERGLPLIEGYLEPSNIIRGMDGNFYVLIRSIPDYSRQSLRGTCLLRTAQLGSPESWRAWNGNAFTNSLRSPYWSGANDGCAFIARDSIGDLNGSLTYNVYLGRYMLVGAAVRRGDGGVPVCGFYYSLSHDLVHWSRAQLLREAKLPNPRAGCMHGTDLTGAESYPSIIDRADPSDNFERPGRDPYLYFVRYGSTVMDRTLMRQPLRITTR